MAVPYLIFIELAFSGQKNDPLVQCSGWLLHMLSNSLSLSILPIFSYLSLAEQRYVFLGEERKGHFPPLVLKILLNLVAAVDGGVDSILNVTNLLGLLKAALTGFINRILHPLALSLQAGSIYFILIN